MSFSPGKWMAISTVNLLWLRDPHDLQGIATNPKAEMFIGRYSLRRSVQQNVGWRLLQRPFDSIPRESYANSYSVLLLFDLTLLTVLV
jgi:hypothetical protein